jgi:hypothetical protein
MRQSGTWLYGLAETPAAQARLAVRSAKPLSRAMSDKPPSSLTLHILENILYRHPVNNSPVLHVLARQNSAF